MTTAPAVRPRVFTWHIHGSYLYYLAQTPCDFYVPVKEGRPEAYGGRGGHFDWPDNVHEVPVDDVRRTPIDVVLFQSKAAYLEDQHAILSEAQRRLPRILVEHDPPRESPTDTPHYVDDPDVLLVHVTHFNDLMWDSGRTPTRVIEHGVAVPGKVRASYAKPRGIAVVNNLETRGRRLGADLFERARQEIPLDLAGMASEALAGLGDLPPPRLWETAAKYRFYFHTARYTSLGLAAIEAMMIGLPVVGLATTELVTVIENGVSGYVDTHFETLLLHMRRLIDDPQEAAALGDSARRAARERFDIRRFVRDWDDAFQEVAGRVAPVRVTVPEMAPPHVVATD